MVFHLSELLGQHLLGDASQGFLQFAETFGPCEQLPKDKDVPLTADQCQCGFHRTAGIFAHIIFLHSIFLVTIALLSAYFF